jgi:hypothetical protein
MFSLSGSLQFLQNKRGEFLQKPLEIYFSLPVERERKAYTKPGFVFAEKFPDNGVAQHPQVAYVPEEPNGNNRDCTILRNFPFSRVAVRRDIGEKDLGDATSERRPR